MPITKKDVERRRAVGNSRKFSSACGVCCWVAIVVVVAVVSGILGHLLTLAFFLASMDEGIKTGKFKIMK
ncbi:hypothetical protein ANO11243_025540 [Dothideomycetidae sp. 11243]|nr:hypothetical protein ANO11243_025540 [fungal sp. No.11243]